MGRSQTQRAYVSEPHMSVATARLSVAYVEIAKLASWLVTSGASPLMIVSFGRGLPRPVSCPVITLDLPQLDGPPLAEVWTSDQPVDTRRIGRCTMAMSGDTLAGYLSDEETRGSTLAVTTESAYRELLHRTHELGFPYLWRIWNFFPRINELQQGLERYRQFCVGRHQALADSIADFPASLSAATAVGTQAGPLQIYFLAGTHPALHLGNPRQMHAYKYPPDYGPRSPSFARATFCRSDHGTQLFIAGTASVVGHTSRHIGLPKEQACETVKNLRALIDHAGGFLDGDELGARCRSTLKVYVRNPDHFTSIRRTLRIPLLASSRIAFLQGDLCRQELLVEVEGLLTSD